jgi:hypothetical protein
LESDRKKELFLMKYSGFNYSFSDSFNEIIPFNMVNFIIFKGVPWSDNHLNNENVISRTIFLIVIPLALSTFSHLASWDKSKVNLIG